MPYLAELQSAADTANAAETRFLQDKMVAEAAVVAASRLNEAATTANSVASRLNEAAAESAAAVAIAAEEFSRLKRKCQGILEKEAVDSHKRLNYFLETFGWYVFAQTIRHS